MKKIINLFIIMIILLPNSGCNLIPCLDNNNKFFNIKSFSQLDSVIGLNKYLLYHQYSMNVIVTYPGISEEDEYYFKNQSNIKLVIKNDDSLNEYISSLRYIQIIRKPDYFFDSIKACLYLDNDSTIVTNYSSTDNFYRVICSGTVHCLKYKNGRVIHEAFAEDIYINYETCLNQFIKSLNE